MQLIKTVFLSFMCIITSILPISCESHTKIFNWTFNTKMFENYEAISLFNIAVIMGILYFFKKDIFLFFKRKKIKKEDKIERIKYSEFKKKKYKFIKIYILATFLGSIIFILMRKKHFSIETIAFSYIITAILILFMNNKKGNKNFSDFNYKTGFLIGLSLIFTFIPTLSPLCIILFMLSRLNFNKDVSFKLTFTLTIPYYMISGIPGIIYFFNNTNYVLENLLGIFLGIIITIQMLKYIKNLYNKNKIYKLSFYCLGLGLFLFIWFR